MVQANVLNKKHGDAISREIDAREEVARCDMAFALTPLVRLIRTGEKREYLQDIEQTWAGGVVKISGLALDDVDIGLMLSFLVVAAQQKPAIKKGNAVKGLTLDKEHKLTNSALERDSVTIKSTVAQVRGIMGIKRNGSASDIRERIKRLATIMIEGEGEDSWAFTNLIFSGKGTKLGEKIEITLSYRLTEAIFGAGSYAAVDMKVFRKLPAGSTRIMYVWLCAWYGGSFGTRRDAIGLNRLIEHAWGIPAAAEMSKADLKNRRHGARNSLKIIESTAPCWAFKIDAKTDKVTTKRIKT